MKRKVVVIGAGSHAAVVIDLIEQIGRDTIIGIVDDSPIAETYEGYGLLGDHTVLPELKHLHVEYFIVAIGDNTVRQALFEEAVRCGLIPMTIIHPSAQISPKATIGGGTGIMANVAVNAYVHVGENVILNTGCTVDHHCVIGDHAHVAPGVHLAGAVWVKNGVLVGIGRAIPPNRVVAL